MRYPRRLRAPSGWRPLKRCRAVANAPPPALGLTVDVATLTLSGVDVAVAGSGAAGITVDVATLTFSGLTPTISGGAAAVLLDTGVLTFTGVTPTVAGSGAKAITIDVGVLDLSGVDVSLAYGFVPSGDPLILCEVNGPALSGRAVSGPASSIDLEVSGPALARVVAGPATVSVSVAGPQPSRVVTGPLSGCED